MDFREMRRKRQQISDAESIEILSKATSGTLALLGDGGYFFNLFFFKNGSTIHI